MILQLGTILNNLLPGLGLQTSEIGRSIFQPLLNQIGSIGLKVGEQFTGQILNRELTRNARNAAEDQIKAQLRAAANVVAPTAAPGQVAVYSGGPPTGTAFRPTTLIPTSIQPPQRVVQTNPDFFPRNETFTARRRPAGQFAERSTFDLSTPVRGAIDADPAFAGALVRPLVQLGRGLVSRAGRFGRAFDPRTPIGRRMLGTGAAAVAGEAALQTGLDAIFNPSVANAPGVKILQDQGNPLRITDDMPISQMIPTGLPARGRYQKEPNGCIVQWYFFDGTSMQPISRQQAKQCVKRECIYRLDVFTGKYVRLKSRRMNPANIGAFFRAGRRVDAMERVARKAFSEARKKKTGTIRRKTRRSRKK